MTRYVIGPSAAGASPMSWSAQMCGCESCEMVLASRSKRSRASGDAERRSDSTLTATVLSRRVSRAR